MAKILTPAQFTADLRKQAMALAPDKRRRFMRKCAGSVMQGNVIIRFLRGGYEAVGDWVSHAKGAKAFGGRFSADYKKRPSGDPVTSASIRMVDTREFANSYRVLDATADSVTVGPGKRAHGGAAEKIADRAENEGNPITGFTSETIGALNTEMQNYLDRMANGQEPPYLPKSRLGVKGVTGQAASM